MDLLEELNEQLVAERRARLSAAIDDDGPVAHEEQLVAVERLLQDSGAVRRQLAQAEIEVLFLHVVQIEERLQTLYTQTAELTAAAAQV
jgi:hypothetical protein